MHGKVKHKTLTGLGMAKNTAETLPRIPNRIMYKQAKYPATRFAHRVSAMIPLFCAKVTLEKRAMN